MRSFSRRTRIGSTDAARRAGSHAANAEQASRTATAPPIATPSNGFTLKSKLERKINYQKMLAYIGMPASELSEMFWVVHN